VSNGLQDSRRERDLPVFATLATDAGNPLEGFGLRLGSRIYKLLYGCTDGLWTSRIQQLPDSINDPDLLLTD
jgi:hypothetical protein